MVPSASIIRGVWGGVLLVDPALPLRIGGGGQTREVTLATRLLGARHLAEALILARRHGPRIRRAIIAVDLLHAGSMLALAKARPDLRRDALLSATTACALVGLSETAGR
ncbi:MAG TPA: hypothetical protein VKR21_16270 [Solirubrobacteraceae bacterium]|nr:hypothetical protein [Solirubrobacteraceae bacterium]